MTRIRLTFDYRERPDGTCRLRWTVDRSEGTKHGPEVLVTLAAATALAAACQASGAGFEQTMDLVNQQAMQIAGKLERRK